MIGKLQGQVDSCFEDYAIIDVQGVGYLVHCSAKTLHKLTIDNFCQLFIETHVREDHINLYGFLNTEEKGCFNILQSVNGIGPRMALVILSRLLPLEIGNAVAAKDKETFRAIPGVGPKMAERILIELKDKLSSTIANFAPTGSGITLAQNNSLARDAISALTNLGINRIDAQNTVTDIINKNQEISINELIKLALKERMRR
ncbi:MAG: Holliday junction branch migration protein RuvA [Rickettsiaceae bacterium]|nr:MAG: Holliday junction branch migration protein RuvA [Rickettsiaceae bacterium]